MRMRRRGGGDSNGTRHVALALWLTSQQGRNENGSDMGAMLSGGLGAASSVGNGQKCCKTNLRDVQLCNVRPRAETPTTGLKQQRQEQEALVAECRGRLHVR